MLLLNKSPSLMSRNNIQPMKIGSGKYYTKLEATSNVLKTTGKEVEGIVFFIAYKDFHFKLGFFN